MQVDRGQSIEDTSMEVIEKEIGAHPYNNMEWPIVRRVIHSTADFDFADKNAIMFSKNAIQNGMQALKNGCSIVTDVNGILGLLNKTNLKDFGNNVVCNISDPNVVINAKKNKTTRAQASMRASAKEIDNGVVVVGNAPTALLEVIDIVNENIAKPALIVGIPVGFICAAESKEALASSNLTYITNHGRKGGSPSAAAIINALFKIIREQSST